MMKDMVKANMPKLKILIIHLDPDDLPTVIDKIRKLNFKSGPFDHAVLLGDVAHKMKDIDLNNLPPLIILTSQEAQATSLQANVTILRGFDVYESPSGLRMGFITLNNSEMEDKRSAILEKYHNITKSVDIFISSKWSKTIADRQKKTLGHELIDKITMDLRPQYHFAYDDVGNFFELEPFLWQSSQSYTRFINIASFNSGKKWAYAFNLYSGADSHKFEKPQNLIENPYSSRKRSRGSASNIDPMMDKKVKIVLPSNCHFCFTNPNIEDHMFLSISNHAYLTIAKGPLSVPKGEMNFSGHCLLVPIEHIPKITSVSDNSKRDALLKDLNLYEQSVIKMNYRKFEMSTVVFEIHSDKSIHFHKQLIPIPKYMIAKFNQALDRQLYLNNDKYESNGKLNFEFFKSNKDESYLNIVCNDKNNFLQFTVYETNETVSGIYLSLFQPEDRIDLQFGRRVMAFLLRLPKRVNWNSQICKQSKEQEEKEVLNFQKGYEEYDIAK